MNLETEVGLERRYLCLIEYWAQTHVNIPLSLMLGAPFYFLFTTSPIRVVCEVYKVIPYITLVKFKPNKSF